ncbi:MAG: hypothetical protein ACRELF_09805, partial [Gemmataceae bacterium]
FLRELFAFSRRLTQTVFVQTLERALRYRIVELETLRRIAWLCMSQSEDGLFYADIDEGFRQRPAYEEGCFTDEPDLTQYDVDAGPASDDGAAPNDDQKDMPESEGHDG